MAAIRLSCATLFAWLLVVSPAPADEVKKPTDTRAKPQAIQKQQSAPALPANVQRADQPKGAPAGGLAGSLNMGKPVAPIGAQTIGGQARGGSATTPATTSTSSQPTSGSTLVNPNAKTDQPGGAMPGDFSREKKLQGVVDGGAGALKSDAAAKEGSAPGRISGADALKETGSLPGPDSGRNTVSKQDEQGRNKDSDKIYDSGGTYLGTRGELTKTGKEQNAGGFTAKEWEAMRKEQTSGGYSDKELRTMRDQQEKDRRGGVDSVKEAQKMKEQQEKELAAQSGSGTKKTQNPETDTGDGHGPKNLLGTNKPQKTQAQIEAERKRQVTLSNDDKQQVERMKADQRAAGATMTARRANAINPGEQAAPVVTGSGQPPSQRGVESGRPQNPTKSGGKPTCPADNPTC